MPPKENEKLYSNKEINVSQSEQENAMRYNNLDDFLQLSFTLKISMFFESLYLPQSNIYDEAFIAKIVIR